MGSCGSFLCKCRGGDLESNAPAKSLALSRWLEDVDMENLSRKESQALPYPEKNFLEAAASV